MTRIKMHIFKVKLPFYPMIGLNHLSYIMSNTLSFKALTYGTVVHNYVA